MGDHGPPSCSGSMTSGSVPMKPLYSTMSVQSPTGTTPTGWTSSKAWSSGRYSLIVHSRSALSPGHRRLGGDRG
ncbi:hypothetical protein SLI_8025 [Streptomyces lividans 1326]|uniref:Uncharacterized protein n=1 Tax=Streptomyces lividans 1326 TaxID=1200984 RepID=A0A7U9HF75_STRLI|nr:hypothetical protein SLI_8025 [Streptomyces lividans 1326]